MQDQLLSMSDIVREKKKKTLCSALEIKRAQKPDRQTHKQADEDNRRHLDWVDLGSSTVFMMICSERLTTGDQSTNNNNEQHRMITVRGILFSLETREKKTAYNHRDN